MSFAAVLSCFALRCWRVKMKGSCFRNLHLTPALQVNPAHQPPESLAPWHDAMAWAPYLAAGQARCSKLAACCAELAACCLLLVGAHCWLVLLTLAP